MAKRQFSTHVAHPEVIDALHDGVPEWMKSSLDGWIHNQLLDGRYAARLEIGDTNLLHRLERLLRINLVNGTSGAQALRTIFTKMAPNPSLKLDVVDGILQLKGDHSATAALEIILLQSGSKWKVTKNDSGDFYLEERVDATTANAMADIANKGGDVALYLTKAWNEAFGRSPNPSVAYSNAIKAVEAAAWPVVIPKNDKATLGTIIQALRDKPESFRIGITEKASNTGIESIRSQLSLVWEGQTDRHGTSNPHAPTQAAAEQALFIVISLSQQFARGLISHV